MILNFSFYLWTLLAAAQRETASANIVDSQPPFRFTWKIDKFSLMNTKKLYSDVFKVGDYKWYCAYTFSESIHGGQPVVVVILVTMCILSSVISYVFFFFTWAGVCLFSPKGTTLYLDVADSATLPYGWSRYARFNLYSS